MRRTRRGSRRPGRSLEKVLATDPHETSALFNLGVLYADFLKKPADAAPLFKRFLADAPSDHPLRADAETYVCSAATANGACGRPAPPRAAPFPTCRVPRLRRPPKK